MMQDHVGQFEQTTEENGRLIHTQVIDDPFIRTTLRPRGWRTAWQVLRGKFELVIRVNGKHNAVYRAVLAADYTPDPPREINGFNSDALMVGKQFSITDQCTLPKR
jgi:hypothetical protein